MIKNSYPYGGDLYHDDYSYSYPDSEFETEFEEGEDQIENWYSDGDALSDEAMNEAEFLAGLSPLLRRRNATMDHVENVTQQIFFHLAEVVDEVPRTEVEEAIWPNKSPSLPRPKKAMESPSSSPKLENLKLSQSDPLRPNARDTNFYEESHLEQPLRIQNVVSDIFSSIAYLFLGWNSSTQSNKTPKDRLVELDKDRETWRYKLKDHYLPRFHNKMEMVFRKAEQLLQSRIEDQKWAFIQRLTLYATLIIAAVGKLTGKKAVLILGLGASAVTLLSMITYYGTASFKLAQQGADLRQSIDLARTLKLSNTLKLSLDHAYETAAKHRLNDIHPK